MSRTSHLISRQGRIYYFVRIPSDLQHFFNSPFIKKSLKTTDKYAAKEDAIVLEHKVSIAFRLIRSGLLSEEQVSSIVSELFPKRNCNGDGSKGGIRLSGLINAYAKEHEHRWGPKTKMENLGTFKLIKDVLGDMDLKLFSKKTIVDLREKLGRLPANVYKLYPDKTIKQVLNMQGIDPMSTMLSIGIEK